MSVSTNLSNLLVSSHSDSEIDYEDDLTDYDDNYNEANYKYNTMRKSLSLNNMKVLKNKKLNYNIYDNPNINSNNKIYNKINYDYNIYIYRLLYNYSIGMLGTHL